MTCTAFYGLPYNPFDKQNVKEGTIFMSRDMKKMDECLQYLKDTRGIGLFTASPGLGKSLALRRFAKTLNPAIYLMCYICLTTVSVREFYKLLCSVLGIMDKGGKSAMFRAIQEQIYCLYQEKRQPLILAIDEAQYLSSAILDDLKMIMNYNYDSTNYCTVILSGETRLNTLLRGPAHEALRQRITVHYNFEGLADDEVSEYIKHKIMSVGGSTTIIDKAALAAVHSNSKGNPRDIDNIMTNALTIGASMQKTVIDAEVIQRAVQSRTLPKILFQQPGDIG